MIELININEVDSSIINGIQLYGSKSKPFIVRNTKDITFNYDNFKNNVINDNTIIYSTDKITLEYVEDIKLLSALNDWENNIMQYNFTDSNINPNLFDYNMINVDELRKAIKQYDLSVTNEQVELIIKEIDYIIVDPFVVDKKDKIFFSEKFLIMRNIWCCYSTSDFFKIKPQKCSNNSYTFR